MSMNVLIAPDKFKGTLTARAAAEAMARGWRQARPAARVTLLPISDGGDGFGELVVASLGARTESVATVNAAHQPCTAQWWWEPDTRTAIIEAAQANGLAWLPAGKHHPFDLDTFGQIGTGRASHALPSGGGNPTRARRELKPLKRMAWHGFRQANTIRSIWTRSV